MEQGLVMGLLRLPSTGRIRLAMRSPGAGAAGEGLSLLRSKASAIDRGRKEALYRTASNGAVRVKTVREYFMPT